MIVNNQFSGSLCLSVFRFANSSTDSRGPGETDCELLRCEMDKVVYSSITDVVLSTELYEDGLKIFSSISSIQISL